MIRLENKKIKGDELKIEWKGEHYANGLVCYLDSDPRGMSIKQMSDRMDLIKKIEKHKGDSFIELEKDDFQTVLSILDAGRFIKILPDLIEFRNDIDMIINPPKKQG